MADETPAAVGTNEVELTAEEVAANGTSTGPDPSRTADLYAFC